MIQNFFRKLPIFLIILLAACAATAPPQPLGAKALQSRCLPHFPDADGWYGADGAYSIALDERRTLWLFGDTFVSDDKGRQDRADMELVLGTTLAVSTCSDEGQFQIRYYLNRKNGKFVSSFDEEKWLWPQDPFIANGVLYLPLIVIQTLPDLPSPFNFKIAGHKIIRISDYSAADPQQWPGEVLDWTDALAPGIEALATSSAVHDGYVYFYPLYRYADSFINIFGNITARLPLFHLENPKGHFEYWTKDNGWQKDLTAEQAKIILPAALSELSVRYFPEEKQWKAIYLSPEDGGRTLFCANADQPQGPWQQPFVLTDKIPEVDPASPLYDRQNICYAGKEQSQFRKDKSIIVTYVCNSLESTDTPKSFIRKNLFLYRPQVKCFKR